MEFPGDVGTALHDAAFGRSDGPILLDQVECTGNENMLHECPHREIGIHNCNHQEDASVLCGHLPGKMNCYTEVKPR